MGKRSRLSPRAQDQTTGTQRLLANTLRLALSQITKTGGLSTADASAFYVSEAGTVYFYIRVIGICLLRRLRSPSIPELFTQATDQQIRPQIKRSADTGAPFENLSPLHLTAFTMSDMHKHGHF